MQGYKFQINSKLQYPNPLTEVRAFFGANPQKESLEFGFYLFLVSLYLVPFICGADILNSPRACGKNIVSRPVKKAVRAGTAGK
jgi:hypothetical protein